MLALLTCLCEDHMKVILEAESDEDLFDIAYGFVTYALTWSVGVSHLGTDAGAFKRRSVFEACVRQLLGEQGARQRWKMPGSVFAHVFDAKARKWIAWDDTTHVQKLEVLSRSSTFVFPPSAPHLQGAIRSILLLSKHGRSKLTNLQDCGQYQRAGFTL